MEEGWGRPKSHSNYRQKQKQRELNKDWDQAEFRSGYHNKQYNKDMTQDGDKSKSQYYYCSKQNQRDDQDRPKYENGNNFKSNQKGSQRRKKGFDRENDKKLIITVDTNSIGLIIGRHGSKIKELQENSGARILIGDRREDDPSLTDVTIIGDYNSQRECEKMINDLTKPDTKPCLVETPKQQEDTIFIDWDAVNEKADRVEKERWAALPPLKKDFYFEHPDVAKMSEEEVEEFRKENSDIRVQIPFGDDDSKILNPVATFEQAFGSFPEIMREIKKMGFDKPSPIQSQAWPILLSGRDLIGIAQTGTGKTLAFLLPALIHIDGQDIPRSERKGANVLVLAPTRELALQIKKEVQKYSYKDIKCVCVYGGGNRQEQADVITQGVEIIIATPGRLNDLVETDVIDITTITYLVLDEADRMLDLGFEPQIRKVLLDIRPDRQSVMTSATWNDNVHRLAEKYMSSPVLVYIGSLDLTAVHSVTQKVWIVEEDEKNDFLYKFIDSLSEDDKVIVFVGKKRVADLLSCDLVLKNISCQCIHGNRDQSDREQAIEDLKTGEVNILIATDVASRGIDISDVTKVFNYDFPRNIEEYVHRVGRTGRAGKTGEAVTLITRSDWAYTSELIKIMEEANQEVPSELYEMRDRFLKYQERKNEEKDGRNREGRYSDERGGGGGGWGERRGYSDERGGGGWGERRGYSDERGGGGGWGDRRGYSDERGGGGGGGSRNGNFGRSDKFRGYNKRY